MRSVRGGNPDKHDLMLVLREFPAVPGMHSKTRARSGPLGPFSADSGAGQTPRHGMAWPAEGSRWGQLVSAASQGRLSGNGPMAHISQIQQTIQNETKKPKGWPCSEMWNQKKMFAERLPQKEKKKMGLSEKGKWKGYNEYELFGGIWREKLSSWKTINCHLEKSFLFFHVLYWVSVEKNKLEDPEAHVFIYPKKCFSFYYQQKFSAWYMATRLPVRII